MKRCAIIAEKDYKEIENDLYDAKKNLLELTHLDTNLTNYTDRVRILSEIASLKIRNIQQMLNKKED